MSRNQIWVRGAILFFAVLVVFAGAIFLLSVSGCPAKSYRGPFSNVTRYKIPTKGGKRTAKGIRVFVPAKDDKPELYRQIDKKADELEACLLKTGALKEKLRRDWFGVYVPSDWYVSTCSKEQLVPSVPSCRLCIDQKGLPLPEKCCGLRKPTAACPCVCNVRATIQDTYWIVTAPNLKLFKAELARLATNQNNPWKVETIRGCLK